LRNLSTIRLVAMSASALQLIGDRFHAETRGLEVAPMTTDGMFSRIVVPTDFSRGSERAWTMAQKMAQNFGAELILLHVLPATPLDVEMQLAAEERKAELRSLQAAHQLGIPRLDDDAAPATRAFEGPFTTEAQRQFSPEGRAWAERLEVWAARGRQAGAKVRTVLRVGVPYQQILTEACESRADLVLLATHGRGEIHRLLVGSVADRVIRMAPCPVFTLKEA
jgi:nucleotide-binding universal stress UspA family protein